VRTGPKDNSATPVDRNLFGALVGTIRPKQWGKNLLVFAAPATGGVLLEPGPTVDAVLAFASFCLVAGGTYIVNDLVDRDDDRAHPTKRQRPIAAGRLGASLAIPVAAAMLSGGIGVGLLVRPALAAIVAGYVVLTIAYTFILRDVVLIDLAAIAGGFLLRAIAGGVATDVALSSWFLMVASFGSLFMAAGKRHSEYRDLGHVRGDHRRTLSRYTESYLRYIQYSSSTVAIAAYALWAFEGEAGAGGTIWSGLSIIPFVLGVLRYGLLLDSGQGGTPEDLVLSDPGLLVLGIAWAGLVAFGVYL
jgi:decaprenyl-phosphate phosphoribosyltransferase